MLHKKPKVKKKQNDKCNPAYKPYAISLRAWMNAKNETANYVRMWQQFSSGRVYGQFEKFYASRGNTQVVWLKLDLGVSRLGISTPDHCLQKVPSSFCN